MSIVRVSTARRAICSVLRAVEVKHCNHNRLCGRPAVLLRSMNWRYLCAHSDVSQKCWRCARKIEPHLFFCSYCNTLQKPKAEYNFYQLFDIEETFEIDSSKLANKFRELQAVLHPDKFSNSSEEEKYFSAETSAAVNRAYRTLADPLERGLYLLELHGMKVPESSNVTDKLFLLQIMDLNEELESLQTKEDVTRFGMKNKETLAHLVKEVTEAFKRQDIKGAKEALSRMKYYSTIQMKFKSKLLDLNLQI